MGGKVLIVDDDEKYCLLIKTIVESEGFELFAALDGETALERVGAIAPDVVLLDLDLPGVSGMQVLERLRASNANLPVIVLTAHGDVQNAVQATRLGAFDFFIKPVGHEEIVITIQRALETQSLKREVEELRKQIDGGGSISSQMGPSDAVAQIIDQVRNVASSTFSVLILGETGTGKELIAQSIHRQSKRHRSPFVALDCGAIPEALLESELFGHEKGAFTGADRTKQGLFQLAEGGTLFLDEVGNLAPALQMKLLRVLESKMMQTVGASKAVATDVRFVAATNHDLKERMAAGLFRSDLYFRLAQYTISLPPLRERPADIPYLATRFVSEASIELRRPVLKVPEDVIALLQQHDWPGNVRELRNVIRRSVLESKEFFLLPALVNTFIAKESSSKRGPGVGSKSLKQTASDAARGAEYELICETLRVTRGNKTRAAKLLDTDFKTLHLKIKSLGIRASDFVL